MSKEVAKKANEYYPELWPLDRMNDLLKADKLTREEYDKIIASAPVGVGGDGHLSAANDNQGCLCETLTASKEALDPTVDKLSVEDSRKR